MGDQKTGITIQTYCGGRNLVTPHGPDAYPDLTLFRPDAWTASVICPADGQTVVGRGGEHLYGYELPTGARADAFALDAGDVATLVRSDLEHCFVEWRVRRATR